MAHHTRCHWCRQDVHARHSRIADCWLVNNRWQHSECECPCTDLVLF